jgi:hypothetical protein
MVSCLCHTTNACISAIPPVVSGYMSSHQPFNMTRSWGSIMHTTIPLSTEYYTIKQWVIWHLHCVWRGRCFSWWIWLSCFTMSEREICWRNFDVIASCWTLLNTFSDKSLFQMQCSAILIMRVDMHHISSGGCRAYFVSYECTSDVLFVGYYHFDFSMIKLFTN